MGLRAPAVSSVQNTGNRLRLVTYNIHKCQGFDRRTSPQRIISVLREMNADVMCLQEVVDAPAHSSRSDQAGEIGRAFPAHTACFGANRPLRGGAYGNLTLSRLTVQACRNVDITQKREARGVLVTDLAVPGKSTVHVFNVHLGTGFMERRYQADRLQGDDLLGSPDLHGPRVVIGDLNEWVKGRATEALSKMLQTFQPRHALKTPGTFPGMVPLVTLDHCFYEAPLRLVSSQVWSSPSALIASDHLPLLVTLEFADG